MKRIAAAILSFLVAYAFAYAGAVTDTKPLLFVAGLFLGLGLVAIVRAVVEE